MKVVGKVMSLVGVGKNADGVETYELSSRRDQELRNTLDSLKESKQEFEGLNDFLREALDVHPEKGRSFWAKAIALVMPRSSYRMLPARFLKLMAEEADVLELIERLMRENINNLQGSARDMSIIGTQKYDELEELKTDIQKAKDEGWDAKKLQEHITQKAGIQIFAEVAKLLDKEFGLLSSEEKEEQRASLLNELESNVSIGQDFIKLIGRVESSALKILHRAVSQYYAYRNVYVPMRVIRDSAETMTDMNESMYASRDAIIITMRTSMEAIGKAIEATGHIAKYSIASPTMNAAIESSRVGLEHHLTALKENERRYLLEAGNSPSDTPALTDGGTVDAKIVGEPRLATGYAGTIKV